MKLDLMLNSRKITSSYKNISIIMLECGFFRNCGGLSFFCIQIMIETDVISWCQQFSYIFCEWWEGTKPQNAREKKKSMLAVKFSALVNNFCVCWLDLMAAVVEMYEKLMNVSTYSLDDDDGGNHLS